MAFTTRSDAADLSSTDFQVTDPEGFEDLELTDQCDGLVQVIGPRNGAVMSVAFPLESPVFYFHGSNNVI